MKGLFIGLLLTVGWSYQQNMRDFFFLFLTFVLEKRGLGLGFHTFISHTSWRPHFPSTLFVPSVLTWQANSQFRWKMEDSFKATIIQVCFSTVETLGLMHEGFLNFLIFVAQSNKGKIWKSYMGFMIRALTTKSVPTHPSMVINCVWS